MHGQQNVKISCKVGTVTDHNMGHRKSLKHWTSNFTSSVTLLYIPIKGCAFSISLKMVSILLSDSVFSSFLTSLIWCYRERAFECMDDFGRPVVSLSLNTRHRRFIMVCRKQIENCFKLAVMWSVTPCSLVGVPSTWPTFAGIFLVLVNTFLYPAF